MKSVHGVVCNHSSVGRRHVELRETGSPRASSQAVGAGDCGVMVSNPLGDRICFEIRVAAPRPA